MLTASAQLAVRINNDVSQFACDAVRTGRNLTADHVTAGNPGA